MFAVLNTYIIHLGLCSLRYADTLTVSWGVCVGAVGAECLMAVRIGVPSVLCAMIITFSMVSIAEVAHMVLFAPISS